MVVLIEHMLTNNIYRQWDLFDNEAGILQIICYAFLNIMQDPQGFQEFFSDLFKLKQNVEFEEKVLSILIAFAASNGNYDGAIEMLE